MSVGIENRLLAALRSARPALMAREILSGYLGMIQDVRAKERGASDAFLRWHAPMFFDQA